MGYKVLKKNNYKRQNLEFKTFSNAYIEDIRKIRNNQRKILRQNSFITKKDQKIYFNNFIKKDFDSETPKTILKLIFIKKKLIGYCGLTNIDWFNKRAELSFIIKSKFNNSEKFDLIFLESLGFLENLIFDELNFTKFFAETYAFRKKVIKLLLDNGYSIEGKLKSHVYKKGEFHDSIILSKFKVKKILNRCSVLITSSSNKTPLVDLVKVSLKGFVEKSMVFCSDKQSQVVTKYITNNFLKLPNLNDKNIIKIKNILNKNKINYILPTRTEELFFWAKHQKFFKKNKIQIFVNNLNSLNQTTDKYIFYKILKKNNILTPKTYLGEVKIPNTIIKPQYSAGGKNIFIKNFKEKDKKKITQEIIKGKEISIDIWRSKNHNYSKILIRERQKINNGETEISKFINNKRIEKISLKVIKLFKLFGIINLQGFLKNKKFYIFDCNARVGGAVNFSFLQGLNFLKYMILEDKNFINKVKQEIYGNKDYKNINATYFRVKKDFSTNDFYF